MKRATYFIAGLFLALTLGALAADSVTPSRLRVLSLGVGTAAGSTNGNINATGTVTAANASISGTANVGGVRVTQAGTFCSASSTSVCLPNAGAIRAQTTGGATRHLLSLWSDDVIYIGSASTPLRIDATTVDLNTSGQVLVNGSQVCTANGTGCPPDQTQKIRSARFGNTSLSGGCNGCSWSKLATGSYQVNWDSNLSDPTCTATSSGTDARTIYPVISFATPSNGSVRVGVYNGIGGTLVDIPSGVNIQVICISGT